LFNARHATAGLSLGSFDVLANLRRSGDDSQKTPKELAASSMLSSGGSLCGWTGWSKTA
jgi:DNA-binding MarR family transcriptional regulator